MKAWVEWHFADFSALKKQGREFNCESCPVSIQKTRKCADDVWDHESPKSVFPIKIIDGTDGFGFCPAKLFRDDPEFVHEQRSNWLGWKMGQMPEGGTPDTMTEVKATNLATLIRHWEMLTRVDDFKMLGRMLGGDSKET